MTPEEWRHIKTVFQRALELSPADRMVWLAAQSDTVRREVESLLRAYEHNNALPETSSSDAPATVQSDQELIGRRFGPYRVLSQLGEGGMGTVWLAERVDGLFTRRVALKLVHPVLMGRSMSERVAREREILASLNHPNIAQLFDAGFAEDGQPYLALEYVSGTPLNQYCDEHRLTVHERLTLFGQVLGAAQYAHAHLVIHRDLKPSNILVSEDGQAHLLDFGVAKLLIQGEAKETQLTQLGGRALTPDYAAPEQIAGASITTAADVYALGVMLYELLTGERPYRLKRDSRGALEEAILEAEPVAPSRLSIGEAAAEARGTTATRLLRVLKGDLDTITSKALKKSPSERYPTANAFGEDIARFLSGDVVLAQPDSVAYRVRKFVWRYRVAVAGVSILFLTLAAGLVATAYEARIASAQRDAALQAQRRSLTQAAAGRLTYGDAPGALAIILEVLSSRSGKGGYTPDALNVFQEGRAADVQALAFTGHMDFLMAAAFSPDGRRIVTASIDGTARVWDAASGRSLQVLRGHSDKVWGAAFSPDGRRIVTFSNDKTARVWDGASGAALQVLGGHTGNVNSAVFSPDGQRIVTASDDKTARVWNAASGQQLRVLGGHTDGVNSAAFSPDGRHIVTASEDKTARVWDAASGQLLRVLGGHTDGLSSAAVSPDGRRIVTASGDKTARIWDAATGEPLRVLSGHTDGLSSAAFSPDGRRIVTVSYDATARVWDTTSGTQLHVLIGHTLYVMSAAFSPDGRRIVTASHDKTARLWDTESGRQLRVLSGHTDRLRSAQFSPDGQHIVTASYDRTARLWDTESRQQLLVLRGPTGKWYLPAALSPDGRRIVTASIDGTARLWDAASGEPLRVLREHTDAVTDAGYSPDGQRIATVSADKTARLWDAASGEPLRVLRGHTDAVASAAFSPDGHRIVTSSADRTARLWDATSGEALQVLRGHTDAVSAAAFSPDGQHVVTLSSDQSVRLWDATSGRQLQVLRVVSGNMASVMDAEFSPDGSRVVTAGSDNVARLWDAASGRQLLVLRGHTDRVINAAFSPDGQRIVTASHDKTARLWDAASGEPLEVLSGHAGQLYHAEFSPDGQRVVTASHDKTARLWDAASGEPLEVLSGHAGQVFHAEFSPDGQRILTTSPDQTARLWDAAAAPLDAQVEWARAAQFDSLSSAERFKLGLPALSEVHQWRAQSKCDQSAAAPYDPIRRAQGVALERIVPDIAAGACAQESSAGTARAVYEHGRALVAKSDFLGARRNFERAIAAGYHAAQVDLGMLLSQPSATMLDVPRAISLYQQAWKDGVTIAAFELGDLYEHGLHRVGNDTEYLLGPDETRAWSWYQKGADAGEPTALARFAARDDRAALINDESAAARSTRLLQAFRYYVAATERARLEDWPDDAWRDWRYRRASIARLLERAGMMGQVATEYAAVRKQYAPPRTLWQRLGSLVGMN